MDNDLTFAGEQGKKALRDWHSTLHDDRGRRARLRRCGSPEEVLLTEDFPLFLQPFSVDRASDESLLALATVAGVLSHVDPEDTGVPFAKQMGRAKKKEERKPAVSEARFRKLQQSEGWSEFYRNLLRVIRLMGKRVDRVLLAEDILLWGAERERPSLRKPSKSLRVRWGLQYYPEADRTNKAGKKTSD